MLNFPGICLGTLGSSCIPKKTRLVPHSIVVYVNSTPYCTSIEVEHHRGPCRCECLRNNSSCHDRQQFLPDSCSCQCSPSLSSEKSVCTKSSVHGWDSETCRCVCKHYNSCQAGHSLNTTTCQCQEIASQECSIISNKGSHIYFANLTVMLLVMVMIITTTIFWITYTKRRRRTLHSFNNIYQQATAEDNIVIDGYSIRMSRDQSKSEVSGPVQII